MKLEVLQSVSSVALWAGLGLAVAAAVLGTVGNWASQKAGDVLQARNEVLQRKADQGIAALNAEAHVAAKAIAEAQERTAKANRSAEEARAQAEESRALANALALKLEHTRSVLASRSLDARQISILTNELHGHHLSIGICFKNDDLEAWSFAALIDSVLLKAGQKSELLGDACNGSATMSAGVVSIAMTARGVPLNAQDGDPLYRGLVKAGIWGGWEQFPNTVPADITHLLLIPSRSAPSIQALEHPTPLPQPKLK